MYDSLIMYVMLKFLCALLPACPAMRQDWAYRMSKLLAGGKAVLQSGGQKAPSKRKRK
jgi:hypothetical protein